MDIVLKVLTVVAPVFLLAAIGWGWTRSRAPYPIDFVTRLTMNISIPALIFTALVRTKVDPVALRELASASLLAYALLGILAFLLLRAMRLPLRTWLAPFIFGNTGNLGLPLALFAYGDIGLQNAVVVFAIMAILSYTFGVWLVSGAGSPVALVREPIVAGTVLGGLFLWQGWSLPLWLTNALELLGQMAIPLMLITLGVAISRLEAGSMGRAFLLSIAKYLLAAGAALVAGWLFGLEGAAFAILVLQLTTPVAVSNYFLAEKYGAGAADVAGFVVISTLVAIIALPATLALLFHFL